MTQTQKKVPQTEQLLKHMTLHGHITQLEAISLYRIFNIKGRINDIRNQGWRVVTDMQTDATGKRYARYSLHENDRAFLRHVYGKAA